MVEPRTRKLLPLPAPLDVANHLYTRQQLGQLTGLDETTLNYWSREGLLVPTEGGEGRGSHRRFDFVQINKAGVLAGLRQFGANIGSLRSFAGLLQSGIERCHNKGLYAGDYTSAAGIKHKLERFRHGEEVLVDRYSSEEKDGMSYHRNCDMYDQRPATSEAEIIAQWLRYSASDYATAEELLAFGEANFGYDDRLQAELYGDLVYDILAPGYSADHCWLVGQKVDGSWRVNTSTDGYSFFDGLDDSPSAFGPGIFLPVSGIIRRIWGLAPTRHQLTAKEKDEMLSRENQERFEADIEQIRGALAAAGLAATVNQKDDEFTVHVEDDKEWPEVIRIFGTRGYRIDQPSRPGAETAP